MLTRTIKRATKLLLSLMLLVSCHSKEMSMSEYCRFFETANSVVTRNIEFSTVRYQIRVVTPEYYALKSLSNITKNSPTEWKARYEEIKDNLYFFIDLYEGPSVQSVTNPQEKAAIVSYYQTFAQQSIHLQIDNDQPQGPDYLGFEDNYGISPFNRILVCFRLKDHNLHHTMRLSYEDKLHGNKEVVARYTRSDFNKIPTLKF